MSSFEDSCTVVLGMVGTCQTFVVVRTCFLRFSGYFQEYMVMYTGPLWLLSKLRAFVVNCHKCMTFVANIITNRAIVV